MLRPLLVWFLLLNYLLVVGAGLRVGRPDAPMFSAAHPYVHSTACQQDHYLRLDCFEQCNGPQHEVTTKLPTETGLHFLAQLKGLDVHCTDWQPLLRLRGPLLRRAARTTPLALAAGVAAGFGRCHYPPPKGA